MIAAQDQKILKLGILCHCDRLKPTEEQGKHTDERKQTPVPPECFKPA